jgi:hypothetical protein
LSVAFEVARGLAPDELAKISAVIVAAKASIDDLLEIKDAYDGGLFAASIWNDIRAGLRHAFPALELPDAYDLVALVRRP